MLNVLKYWMKMWYHSHWWLLFVQWIDWHIVNSSRNHNNGSI